MKKISEMVQQTRMRVRQRPRMRTKTKFVLAFGVSSILSITVAVIYFFNFSQIKEVYGTGRVVDGKMEVVDKALPSGFEVKELDTNSPTMAHDTVVLFKKMKP